MSGRFPLLALLAALGTLLASPAKTHATGKQTAMEDSLPLFAIVDSLVDARPLTVGKTGKLVGGTLAPLVAESTERKLVYVAQATPEFDRVELRVQSPASSTNGQFLILDLNARRCVNVETVQRRYGAQPEVSVPTPREPADTPVFLKYAHDWGTVSFGFARIGPECLRTVVINVASKP